MLLKIILFILSFSATFWLWGHWNFGKSAGLSLLLFFNSAMLFYLVLYPIYDLTQNTPISVIFKKKMYWTIFWLYLLSTLILSVTSFYGLILYILPLKILLIGFYAYLKYKIAPDKKSKLEKSLKNQ